MSSDRHEFGRITFGVPAQTFRVSAFISTEERLPAVTEFVMRLLHTCGRLSLGGFRQYFGFSEAEALTVIESLDRLGYVRLSDDFLTLSEEMVARFEASPDECPWVTKLKKRTDAVPFDLLAFTPLRRGEFTGWSDNWVKLNPAPEVVGNGAERAKQAYRENFAQIEREFARARGEERERSFGVHSIENVEPRRPNFIPVTVSLGVEAGNRPVISLPEAFESLASPVLVANFRDRMVDEFERSPASGSSGVPDFLDLFRLDFLRAYVTGEALDAHRYAGDVRRGMSAPAGVQPLFGSICLKDNREAVSVRIHEARQSQKRSPQNLSSLAWLAPDYEYWGRGEDFRSTVEMWGKALKAAAPGDDLYVFDFAQERQEASARSQYGNTGVNELHLLRPQAAPLMPYLEVILYPGQFAVAMLHAQAQGHPGIRVPFGILSSHPHHLQVVHNFILDCAGGSRYAGRWSGKKQAAKGKPSSTLFEACPFLAYSDVDFGAPKLSPEQ